MVESNPIILSFVFEAGSSKSNLAMVKGDQVISKIVSEVGSFNSCLAMVKSDQVISNFVPEAGCSNSNPAMDKNVHVIQLSFVPEFLLEDCMKWIDPYWIILRLLKTKLL
jgi:hypothetical protein